MTKLHTYDLVLIALFTALLGICAWVSIPGPVPFTLRSYYVEEGLPLLVMSRGKYSKFKQLWLEGKPSST